jgi:hypothetical protein
MSTELDLSFGKSVGFAAANVEKARRAQLTAATAGSRARLNDLITFLKLAQVRQDNHM